MPLIFESPEHPAAIALPQPRSGLAADKCSERLSALRKYLQSLSEPLRSEVAPSPSIPYLSPNFFQVSLRLPYSQQDRQFARWLREADPSLLQAIVEADLNTAQRDPKITAIDVGSSLGTGAI